MVSEFLSGTVYDLYSELCMGDEPRVFTWAGLATALHRYVWQLAAADYVRRYQLRLLVTPATCAEDSMHAFSLPTVVGTQLHVLQRGATAGIRLSAAILRLQDAIQPSEWCQGSTADLNDESQAGEQHCRAWDTTIECDGRSDHRGDGQDIPWADYYQC
jgi:hypothetical protein